MKAFLARQRFVRAAATRTTEVTLERRVHDGAMHHFKSIAEHLSAALEKGLYEKLIIGCHDTSWHELESQLHPYVKQRLLGHFPADLSRITNDQIREQASRILRESLDQRRKELAREAISQAKSNARGVTGLRRVLKSLELGEVQTLLIGDKFSHLAVECGDCGHLDAHMVRQCPLCGHETREIEDVIDAMIPAAIIATSNCFTSKMIPSLTAPETSPPYCASAPIKARAACSPLPRARQRKRSSGRSS